MRTWLSVLLTEMDQAVVQANTLAQVSDVHRALNGRPHVSSQVDGEVLADWLRGELLGPRPVYEAVDALYGTEIGSELDEW